MGGASLPSGFHINQADKKQCPRGLEGINGVDPSGQSHCSQYNSKKCSQAMGERLYYPKDREKTKRQFKKRF